MQIVELGDCSMVIMKDSSDAAKFSIGNLYRFASKFNRPILVDKDDQLTFNYLESSDAVYTAGRLVLFFKDSVPSRFKLHEKVRLDVKIGP